MKAAESLFEFMPYGAPELLQSSRERLASAILVSSLTIAAVFAVAGGLVRLIVAPAVVILPPHCSPRFEIPQNWTVRRPPVPPRVPGARSPRFAGFPVPSAEPDVPLVRDDGKSVDGV